MKKLTLYLALLFMTTFTYAETLSLPSGWSLVGVNSSLTIDELKTRIGSDNLLVIQGQDKTYQKVYVDREEDFLNNFTAFETGKGYWVKVASAVDIEYDKTTYSTEQTINLVAGWNLINPPTDLTMSKISTQLGSNLEVIQGMDETFQKVYTDNGQDFLNTFQKFEEPQGYWVKVTADASLRFPVNIPTPPPTIDLTSFITTWKTDIAGASNDKEIIISIGENTFNYDYNYDIDWTGDGTWDTIGATGTQTHIYPQAGTYTIKIRGQFPHILANNKILSVEQWGNIEWLSMYKTFEGCSNLVINAKDRPNLSNVTSMNAMFRGATSFNKSLNNWDVSNVINMKYMFENVTLSLENYARLLKSWSTQTLKNNVTFNGGNSQYCLAKNERASIISNYHWNISDGGEGDCSAYQPTISSPDSIIIKEQTHIDFKIEANAQNSLHDLTYTIIGGDDFSKFELNITTGVLNFESIPDFEHPLDSNGDNNYNIEIEVDNGYFTTTQTINIQVLDVNENTEPTVGDLSGDVENNMVTVFDREVAVVKFDISDAQTPSNELSVLSPQNFFLIMEKAESDTNQNTIDFFHYLDTNGLKFMCQDRNELYWYLDDGKSYERVVELLAPERDNCLQLKTVGNITHLSLPISYYGFNEGEPEPFYKKDKPFIYGIKVDDGEMEKTKNMVVLFRDKNRTSPLTEETDIVFDLEGNNLYKVTDMKPTYMPWATSWSIEGKPNWATFDTTTGELSGTAPEGEAGNYDINISGYKTFANGLVAKDTESFTLKLLPTDRVPDAFTFEPTRGVDIHTMVSTSITITGLTQGAMMTLNGDDALYRINGGDLHEEDREVHNGDTITFTMRSPSEYSTTRELHVTIGGVSAIWVITTQADPQTNDTTPDEFHFTQLTNVEFLAMQQGMVDITGINANTSISINNGEYSLDKGTTWTNEDGTILADEHFKGQIVYIRHRSGDSYGVVTQTGLTVGSRGASFTSTVKSSGEKATPPNIQPTAPGFCMDRDFTLTFTDNALWRSKITELRLVGSLMAIDSMDGIRLIEGTEYTINDGRVVIHSAAIRTRKGGEVMDYIGSWTINISATGYEDAYPIFEVKDGAPIVTTSSIVDVPENQTAVIDVNAIAEEDITFSIIPEYDSNKFSINVLTGELKFKVAPDYETPESVDSNNVYKVKVEVRDVSNRTYVQTITVTVTDVDETPSPTPTVAPDLVDANDTGHSTTDNITKLNEGLTFEVPCLQKDTIIRLYFNNNWYNNSHTCEGAGTEQIVVPLIADGTMSVNYTQQLTTTNQQSAYSPTLTLTIDSMKPTDVTMADLQEASDTGSSQTDNTTSVRKPTFDIKCDGVDSVIEMWLNSTLEMTACTSADNDSIFVHNSLADGSYKVIYRIIDIAGNISDVSPSMYILIDGTAPDAPTVENPTSGAIVSGTAEKNTNIVAHTATSSCSTTIDSAGNYSCTLTPAPINGETVEVFAMDDAGNISPKVTTTVEGETTNHPPVVTSESSFTFYEHEDVAVVAANIDAEDPDGDLISFAMVEQMYNGSADWEKFTIDATGIVRFKKSPDYEFGTAITATDAHDVPYSNHYAFYVDVSDGKGYTIKTSVLVTVVNKNSDITYSPEKFANNVAVDSNLRMSFISPIKALTKGTGSIKIFKKDGDSEHTNFDVSVEQVEVLNNQITINPNAEFEPETEYYVLIDRGAFKDADGVDYIGIVDKTAWTFTTDKAPEPVNPCGCPDFADCMAN